MLGSKAFAKLFSFREKTGNNSLNTLLLGKPRLEIGTILFSLALNRELFSIHEPVIAGLFKLHVVYKSSNVGLLLFSIVHMVI